MKVRRRIKQIVLPTRDFWVAAGEVNPEEVVLLVDQALSVEMMKMEVLTEGPHMDIYTEHQCLLLLLVYHHAGSGLILPRNLMARKTKGIRVAG